ncbi:MAG: EmrB/QacA family drug resistance transporter, partial [Acidobacteriales bacterium]|nr:EmrB/QacA family drug resistance transporter [Terriglobales bacterium]
ARNIGGSVGISIVTTMLDRKAQVHQVNLSAHLSASNPAFQRLLQTTTSMLQSKGYAAADATHRAYALIQGNVFRQANMLAYIDNFSMLGFAMLAMVPLVFIMKRPRTGSDAPVH